MKLIIGLGNPWKQYENNRHNIGYRLVESIFEDWKVDKKSISLLSSNSTLDTHATILGVKPETFMNLSGNTVSALVSFYKLDIRTDILVISDDIDMEFWKVRYRSEWSHGGQNGLRDIITKLWSNEFSRIKVGVGRNDLYSVSDWVLSNFTQDEKKIIETEIQVKVQDSIIQWLWD